MKGPKVPEAREFSNQPPISMLLQADLSGWWDIFPPAVISTPHFPPSVEPSQDKPMDQVAGPVCLGSLASLPSLVTA